jgi:hypothetical protein
LAKSLAQTYAQIPKTFPRLRGQTGDAWIGLADLQSDSSSREQMLPYAARRLSSDLLDSEIVKPSAGPSTRTQAARGGFFVHNSLQS